MRGEEIVLNLYEFDDIAVVPREVGIYAWFLHRLVPTDNYEATQFSKSVQEISEFTRPDKIDLASQKNLGVKWSGYIEPEIDELDGSERKAELFIGDSGSTIVEHLNNILVKLNPILYIGKADNLYSRINQHISAIHRLNAGGAIEEDFDGREFAERVKAREIPIDHLRFTFFEFPESSNGENNIESFEKIANRYVESLANRFLRPLLGKK